jgi:Uma2 family endonuclease
MTAIDIQTLHAPPWLMPRAMYDEMISAGILTKEHKVELIQGQMITKMPIGTKHSRMVNTLVNLLCEKLGRRAVIAPQNPVALHEFSEPEPDLAIVRPPATDCDDRHPEPADIFFLIEVADTSLRFDRDGKVPLYAACDIPECWLVDLNERVITVYSKPTATGYLHSATYRSGDLIRPSMFPDVELPVVGLGW